MNRQDEIEHDPGSEELCTESLQSEVKRLEMLHRVGVALSAERNRDRLLESILIEAKELCNADGGTLYLRTEEDDLRFAIMRTDSLGIALGGTTGKDIGFRPLPLFDEHGQPNRRNVATCAVHERRSFNIPDAYDATGFDFRGTKAFDEGANYRSCSFLTIPLVNSEDRVIAVLQLLNARDAGGTVVPFEEDDERIVQALASQAAVALENQLLLDGQKALLEAFIQMIAAAIDAKSPYTGGHCERVPVLTMLLARAACDEREGAFGDFDLSDEQWYELKIAAWLHDCGKVTTPVHIMDKATKLEAIWDRIGVVRSRFEVLKRDLEIASLKAQLRNEEFELSSKLEELDEELAFLERANIGSEFLPEESKAKIRRIGQRQYRENGKLRRLLSAEEVEQLCISRGTLSESERLIINGHMVQTIEMLEALPFPRNLRRVPEYAGGHHEKMDGKGYPKGLYAGDMSIPARIMAIADVFEALTAQDRPYKKGKTLSESMRIMGFMKRDNHLDPELFDLFVRSGVYREYGHRYLPVELIDEVDEAALLAIEPKPVELPPVEFRNERRKGFLPQYEPLRVSVMGEIAGEKSATHQ